MTTRRSFLASAAAAIAGAVSSSCQSLMPAQDFFQANAKFSAQLRKVGQALGNVRPTDANNEMAKLDRLLTENRHLCTPPQFNYIVSGRNALAAKMNTAYKSGNPNVYVRAVQKCGHEAYVTAYRLDVAAYNLSQQQHAEANAAAQIQQPQYTRVQPAPQTHNSAPAASRSQADGSRLVTEIVSLQTYWNNNWYKIGANKIVSERLVPLIAQTKNIVDGCQLDYAKFRLDSKQNFSITDVSAKNHVSDHFTSAISNICTNYNLTPPAYVARAEQAQAAQQR